MKHQRRLAPILLATVLAITVAPAFDGHAQGVPADPGLAGPHATEQFNVTLQGLGATVFYPGAGGAVSAGGPFSGLVLGHGFARARAQHANNGVFLASHGFVVVTVDFPNPFSPDFDAWVAQIGAALDWLEAQNADPVSRFYQQIAVDRLGALGHSAGGMATWVAAGQDSRIRAIMPLDPVPADGADLATLGAAIAVPSGWTGAPGTSCNAGASYTQLYPLVAAGHKAQYIVSNATHCDFEDPSNFLCTLTCGGTSDARRQIWRRYTVAWFKYYLDGNTGYYHYLHGNGLAGDLAAGRLTGATARNTEPRNASAQALPGGGAARLSWQPYPVTPLAGYSIHRRLLPDPSSQQIATPGMTGSFDDVGLPAGQYEYTLYTRDAAGNEHQPLVLPPLDIACYTFDVAPAACDGQVDALDIQTVALAWQFEAGQPGYDIRFDVDGDQTITILDVQTFAAQWGWPAD
jgi:dienelactone hydrolase